MSRHGKLQLDFVSSDDGRHCSIDCPHTEPVYGAFCDIYGPIHCRIRPPACIAAEQAAASADGVADMLRDDLSECVSDARDMADQLNECARLLGCERGDIVRSLEAHLAGGRVVASMLVAREREQAAASVPSCEGEAATLALRNVRALATRLRRTDPENAAHLLRFCESAGVVGRILRDADDHLDGGARSLDASEALREARVQGMREAMGIALRWIDREESSAARAVFEAAIEAVRKGER